MEVAQMDSNIEYKLTALVDDKVVFESTYPDTAMLVEDLSKAEVMVERELENE